MDMTDIDRAFRDNADRDWAMILCDPLDVDGWLLRDATLEDVEHYFVYHADEHAERHLG